MPVFEAANSVDATHWGWLGLGVILPWSFNLVA
jgi:hypothetical protein